MLTPLRTFTNGNGRTFAVRLLPDGAVIGTSRTVTDDGPSVEVWDTTYAQDTNDGRFGVLGQFVSRYALSSLLAARGGLCLDGGYSTVWSWDAYTLTAVQAWLTILSTEPAF